MVEDHDFVFPSSEHQVVPPSGHGGKKEKKNKEKNEKKEKRGKSVMPAPVLTDEDVQSNLD